MAIHHPVKARHRLRSVLHYLKVGVLLSLLLCIFLASAFFLWAATIHIPDFSLFNQRQVDQSTKIYDRTGKILLYDVHKDIKRTIVPDAEISPYIKDATIAIEDTTFYTHIGINPRAIIRAVLVNLHLRDGYAGQGGSTITQQVIKNALLTKEKTLTRKLKEWILAIKLERMMSKQDILTLYLNEAPYGGSIYGVEEAAMAFFGKHASEVTLAEAAYLAALPQAPTTYSPYGSHKDKLEERKNLILMRMRDTGKITDAEYASARVESVVFIRSEEKGIQAPHFVMFVKEELADLFGEEAISGKGLRVVTTLDVDLQTLAEETVKTYALQNEVKYNASNAALVALDPKTGHILAMAGSRDYFDPKIDGNYNIALAKRQPGSAFKPFVYALAFSKGYTPDTVVFDVPTQFSTVCDAYGNPIPPNTDVSRCYMPGNYDEAFRGPISFRNALAQSVNIPAVKALYLVGIKDAIDYAELLGVKTLTDKSRYGLTLVLGGGEVTLLDMTSAYGVFANNGKRNPYEGILRVESADGEVLREFTSAETQVIDPGVAHMISDVLSDNVARTPAFGSDSYLHFPDRQVAVKTGTTNDYRDAWIIGYTPDIAVGAWAGNNDNTPMEKKVAGFIVAPLWNTFMRGAFPKIPDSQFPRPPVIGLDTKPALRGVWEGSQTYIVDKMSGKLATDLTPDEYKEERVIASPHDILYFVNKDDPKGPQPANPNDDPQYELWETPTQNWLATHGFPSTSKISMGAPSEQDNIHTIQNAPVITFQNPTASSTTVMMDGDVFHLSFVSIFPVVRVDYTIDGTFIDSKRNYPYDLVFDPETIILDPGTHSITATAIDSVGNRGTASVSFVSQ